MYYYYNQLNAIYLIYDLLIMKQTIFSHYSFYSGLCLNFKLKLLNSVFTFSAQNSKASIEIIVKGPETYKSVNDVWSKSGTLPLT